MEPASIDTVQFKTTRVKEGYDQDEVDDFLDRVREHWDAAEEALHQTKVENDRLRRQLKEAQAIADAYDVTAPIPVASPAESATRILEFAQRTADEVMADAKGQADELLATTRNQCEALKNEARGTVYQLEQDAKQLQTKVDDTKNYIRDYLRRALSEVENS